MFKQLTLTLARQKRPGSVRKQRSRRLVCERLESRNLLTAGVTNLGLEASGLAEAFVLEGDLLAMIVAESNQGIDLNADGDTLDSVLQVHDFRTGITTNLGLQATNTYSQQVFIQGDFVAFQVYERWQGMTDLNGDGDISDLIMHVYDAKQGVVRNLGLDLASLNVQFQGSLLAFPVQEREIDLNGDGSLDIDDTVLHVYDSATGIVTNTGLSVSSFALEGERIVCTVSETSQGNADLNGDGDTLDGVVHVFDIATGTATNLQIAGTGQISGNLIAAVVREADQGNVDLNGDGDALDWVMYAVDVSIQQVINLGLQNDARYVVDGGLIAFLVRESRQGNTDLNGDGDTFDTVLHVFNSHTGSIVNLGVSSVDSFALSRGRLGFRVRESAQANSDLNGDGDVSDLIVHLFDASTGTTVNLGLASVFGVRFEGDLLFVSVSESAQGNADLNGDADVLDSRVLHVFDANRNVLTNLQLAQANSNLEVDGNLAAFAVSESGQGAVDRNGDGDALDTVLYIYNARTVTATNLGLAQFFFHLDGTRVVFPVPELAQGNLDTTGDGDTNDRPLYVVELAHVLPDALLMFEQTANDIKRLDLNAGIRASLFTKLEGARLAFLKSESTDTRVATNLLTAMLHQILAIRGKQLSFEASDFLIDDLYSIFSLLEAE